MGIKKILALLLVLFSVAMLFKKSFVVVFTIGLIIFVVLLIVRWLADLFWWGKDKGKW